MNSKPDAIAAFAWQAIGFDPNVSVMLLSDVVQSETTNATYWRAYGVALVRAGRAREAIQAFERAQHLDRANLEGWCILGELLMDELEWLRAGAAFQECLKLDRAAQHPSGIRARALIKKGEKLLAQQAQKRTA